MSGTYDAAVDQLNEDAPSWLAARRQKGLEAWANAAMPTAQDELLSTTVVALHDEALD